MIEFGSFTLDTARFELCQNGRPIHIQRKVFDFLLYLIEHRERLVPTQELLDGIWHDTVVTSASIRRTATFVRSALQDDVRKPRWISNVHGRGYRFIGETVNVRRTLQASPRDVDPNVEQRAETYRTLVVGREDQQCVLIEAMRGVSRGDTAVVLLEGELGIGKSRLLEWCAAQARSSGLEPLLIRCTELDGAPQFWAWRVIARQLSTLLSPDVLERVQKRVSLLARPSLENHESSPTSHALPMTDPRVMRFQASESFLMLLREASRTKPIALLLDDIHRLDESTLALFEVILRGLDVPVAWVCSLRSEGGDRKGIARLARDTRCRTLRLSGLDRKDILTLMNAAGSCVERSELASEIWRQTGGNPFLIHQTLPEVMKARHDFDAREPIARILPRSVCRAIEEQCADLTVTTLDVLRSAAVIGHDFSAFTLARAHARPLKDTLEAVDEAVRAGLLIEDPERPLHYKFLHSVIRDVLHDRAGSGRRTEVRRRISFSSDRAELGRHHASQRLGGTSFSDLDYW